MYLTLVKIVIEIRINGSDCVLCDGDCFALFTETINNFSRKVTNGSSQFQKTKYLRKNTSTGNFKNYQLLQF